MQSGSLKKRCTARCILIKFTDFKGKEILHTSRKKNIYPQRKDNQTGSRLVWMFIRMYEVLETN